MHRVVRQLGWLGLLLAGLGCATKPIRPSALMGPPTEQQRQQFGTVRVHSETNLPHCVWQLTKGKGAAAAIGAGRGASVCLNGSLQEHSGLGFVLMTLASPVFVLAGAGGGALLAEPASVVRQHESALDQAVAQTAWATVLRDKVVVFAQQQAKRPLQVAAEPQTDSVLELNVTELGLLGEPAARPVLQFVVVAEARLRRCRDQQVLHQSRWLAWGRESELADWAADGAQRWRQELQELLGQLAQQITEQLFCLYQIEESRP